MKIGQGKDKVKDYLKNNKEICDEVEKKVRDFFAQNQDLIPTDSGDDDNVDGMDSAVAEETEEKPVSENSTEDKPKKRGKKKAVEETEDDFSEFATEDIE